jgi:AcrR family transcriptional regulator
MKEVREDRRTRKTKKLYENALIELLKTKDINKITVTDLSEMADCTRGTFYIHYDDIYDLLESIESNMIYELEYIAEAPLPETANSIFEDEFARILKALEFIDAHREVFKALLNEQGNLLFLSRIKKNFSQKLLHNFLNVTSNVDKKYNNVLSSFLISGFIGIIQEWIKEDSDISVLELATVILTMLRNSTSKLDKS